MPNNIALINNVKMVIVMLVYNVIFVNNVVPVLNNMLMLDDGLLLAAIKHLPVNWFRAVLRHVVVPVEKFHMNFSLI